MEIDSLRNDLEAVGGLFHSVIPNISTYEFSGLDLKRLFYKKWEESGQNHLKAQSGRRDHKPGLERSVRIMLYVVEPVQAIPSLDGDVDYY